MFSQMCPNISIKKFLNLVSTGLQVGKLQKKCISYHSQKYFSSKSLDISGIYPPIITNFDEKGRVSHEQTKINLEKWNEIPFKGYVVLGSTGEFVFMSEEERCELVKFVKKSSPLNKLLIAGSGCESTSDTIHLTNKMADVGADAALVVSPFFYKGRMTEDILYQHYNKVADASKIPIILYSVPANTGIDLGVSLVEKLADHPNIIGMKDSGGDISKIGQIVHKTKTKDFQVLAGSAGFLYSALSVGCVGGVLALANVLGKPLCDLYTAAKEGRRSEAQDLQLRLIGPNISVTKQFGIPGVKAAMDLSGYVGGACRPPLQPLDSADTKRLEKEFRDNGFL